MTTQPQWIAMDQPNRGNAAPMFRREFDIPEKIVAARLEICGLGFYEAWINGQRVGQQVLHPAQTDYDQRCFFTTHDVAPLLQQGANALGVILGEGWFHQHLVWPQEGVAPYGTPRFYARLEIQTESSPPCVVVCTDASWVCATGALQTHNIYAGEWYDARAEKPGWDRAGYDHQDWIPVECVSPPTTRIEEQHIPPIMVVEDLQPIALNEPQPGVWVVDLGQNFAGWVKINLSAPAGTQIQLRFAEAVFPDGMIDTASTGVFATNLEQIDTYICKGTGLEVWEPRFVYHGFRYVEIRGWHGNPAPDAIVGRVVHTALPQSGQFECSDDRLNQLHRMALWTHRSNIHSIPEDCPARERCGWLGDAHVVCEYSIYNFQGLLFWEKYLGDIETTRTRNGGLPCNIAPGQRTCGTARPDWMAALVLIPWYLHVYYGTRVVLETHWYGMRAVLEHFRQQSQDWILAGGHGDWCDPRGSTAPTYTSEVLTTTVWFYECTRIMARVARLLGFTTEADEYQAWLAPIRQAFHSRFYDTDKHTFGSQTGDALALHFGLVPDGETPQVVASLVNDIGVTHNTHHSVGIMGLRYLFEVLTRFGHGTLALELLHQNTYPSFGDLIARGATTLWEYWGEQEVDQADGPRSLNHPMMGGFDNWFYNTLAGIRPDQDHPGFKHFFLEPYPIQGLQFVKAYHDTPYGRISSNWQVDGGRVSWHIVIPDNTTATARLPVSQETRMLEPGVYQIEEPISS